MFSDDFDSSHLILAFVIAIFVFVIFGSIASLVIEATPRDNTNNRIKMSNYVLKVNNRFDGSKVASIKYNQRTDNLTVVTKKPIPEISIPEYNPATHITTYSYQPDTSSAVYQNGNNLGKRIIKHSPAPKAKNYVHDEDGD